MPVSSPSSEEAAGSALASPASQAQPTIPFPRHLAALGLYLGLALAATWPMPLHFTTQAVGEHLSDRTANIWSLWWLRVALLEQHANPFHTDLVFYPQGTDLYYHILNLPSFAISLAPHILFGLTAAYNFSVFAALVLGAYAGFRLGAYLTGAFAPALVAGTLMGFNALTLHVIQGQLNIFNTAWFVLCVEFYLRAWASARPREALASGIFFALAVLTQGYFEFYLAFFLLAHLLYMGVASLRRSPPMPAAAMFARGLKIAAWAGLPVLLLAGPFVLASLISLRTGSIDPAANAAMAEGKSADLARFLLPPPTHWLFGGQTPSAADRASTYLGWVALAFGAIGLFSRRRDKGSPALPNRWLWAALVLLGITLALGPTLRFSPTGPDLPLPYALLQDLPIFRLISAPERFAYLAYLGLAVLAAYGVHHLLARLSSSRRVLAALAALLLVLVELPFHTRLTLPLESPASLQAMATGPRPQPGGALELPLVQQGWKLARRMLYQTQHGRPITSAYLSRPVTDPYSGVCSPYKPFTQYPPDPAPDIVSPASFQDRASSLLTQAGIGYIVLYKEEYSVPYTLEPLSAGEMEGLIELGSSLGTLIGEDSQAAVYRVNGPATPSPVLQLGEKWHPAEQSGTGAFRWMDGPSADLCVFSPEARSASLHLRVTSFAAPRHLQVWVADLLVFEEVVPADGALHAFSTPPIEWPGGPQRVSLVVPEGSASPSALGTGGDSRQLSIGFGPIALAPAP